MGNTFRQETVSEIMALGDPPLPYVEINSDGVRALMNDRLSSRPVTKSYIVGVFVDRNPFATVLEYGPLLRWLEESISKSTGTPIAFGLRIYREQQAGARDLAAGSVHFMPMNALWYVRAHRENSAVRPLVRRSKDVDAVIFTRRNTGITNLAQLHGKSLAFGEQASTVSFLAKAELARAGVRRKDLSSCKFAHELEPDSHRQAQLDREYVEGGYIYSRSAPIYAVLKGRFDAGVALYNRFYLVHDDKLAVLERFRHAGSPWVVGPRIDKAMADAFQRALSALTDSKILEELPASSDRYVEARDEDYNEFRLHIPQAELFDGVTELSGEGIGETKGSR
jgi:ABC-type phosphate/phosphonate transport system substrate-binding protein